MAGPFALCGGLIDDDDLGGGGRVTPVEVAAFNQCHAHGAEIVGRNDFDGGALIGAGRVRYTFGVQVPAAEIFQGKIVGDAGGFDTGNGRDPAQHLLKHGRTFQRAAVIVVVNLDGRGVAGLEAEVDVHDVKETAEKKAGTDEQDAGECDL